MVIIGFTPWRIEGVIVVKYIAHKRDDGTVQTVKEHLVGTAKLARKFGSVFGMGEIAEQIGLFHDVGKYSAEFQDYIWERRSGRVDHSSAGAQLLANYMSGIAAYIADACIAAHHTGLLNTGNRCDLDEDGTLMARLKKKVPDFSAFQTNLPQPPKVTAPEIDSNFSCMVFVHMLFSCLTDADFLDTERFMQPEAERNDWDDIEVLAATFWRKLNEKGFLTGKPPINAQHTDINAKRTEILQKAIAEGQKTAGGIFTLTVPTGGGKTIASTAFALAKCQALGLRRIIYVIPYTSIIEQTADVLRGLLNEEGDRDNILEHHSSAAYDEIEGDEKSERYKLAAENWDAPIVVTTNVQFFESLFASRTSKCRKLHNIADSVVIFDEAQMFPVAYLKIFLQMIAELNKRYGVTCLLASATQPPWIRAFGKIKTDVAELMPNAAGLHDFFARVTYKNMGTVKVNDIAQKMRQNKQAVTIALTKKSAMAIYQSLGEEDGNYYLSTNLCPKHRREVIAEIKRRLLSEQGETCRVVSTSVISVGVDLDFPIGFAEFAGLDSIIQAAGRVNREGKHEKEESVMYIFTLRREEGFSLNADMKQRCAATEIAIRNEDDISCPKAVENIFRNYTAQKIKIGKI